MNQQRDVLIKEYKKLISENKILRNQPINLKDFRKVVAIMQQLTLNTFKIETLKSLINK